MKRVAWVLAIVLCAASTAWAGATVDLRIDRRQDEKRNTIYLLINTGTRLIEAKVEMLKDCTGNRRKPVISTFWVEPGKSKQIAKVWAETSCRHSYRVQEAEYR